MLYLIILLLFGGLLWGIYRWRQRHLTAEPEAEPTAEPRAKQRPAKDWDLNDGSLHNSDYAVQLLNRKLNEIVTDFRAAPYKDKFNDTFGYKDRQGDVTWIYNFEGNRRKMIFRQKYDPRIATNVYYLDDYLDMTSIKIAFVNVLKVIEILKGLERSARTRQGSYHHSYRGTTYTSGKQTQTPPKTEAWESNPKYIKLLGIYKLRKTQLDQMKKNDPERTSLENELKVVASKLEAYKQKAKS